MSKAKLTALTIDNFKSFAQKTRIELAPLTIILGRNNSGKSTLIQSLLLLKQTLNTFRSDVTISLEGIVDAFNLRELTHGWPAQGDFVRGPEITIEWESDVDVSSAMEEALWPERENLARQSGVSWLKEEPTTRTLTSSMALLTSEVQGVVQTHRIELRSIENGKPVASIDLIFEGGAWTCNWGEEEARKIGVDLDHFIPYLRIDRRNVGPRDRQRTWHNAYLILFAQPLEELKQILSGLHYLGSFRQPPPSLFKAATASPSEIGISGEFAAQLLHRRQKELVHFLPISQISASGIQDETTIKALPLVDAVNKVMNDLSVQTTLRVEEIQEVGFRLMFGDASLVHVGRGLSYLLPLVELGLFADPLRFQGEPGSISLDDYVESCDTYTHIALEEPEAHLHPKVASRLAQWLVSLARSNRRLLVETHSDHLVRRLRGLVARAGHDSALEMWLLKNVVILSVEQSGGITTVNAGSLSAEGGLLDVWPEDFMDEATDEESAIYYAKLDKKESETGSRGSIELTEDPEPDTDSPP